MILEKTFTVIVALVVFDFALRLVAEHLARFPTDVEIIAYFLGHQDEFNFHPHVLGLGSGSAGTGIAYAPNKRDRTRMLLGFESKIRSVEREDE